MTTLHREHEPGAAQGAPILLRLQLHHPDGSAQRLTVAGDRPVVVGRDPQCDIVISSVDVSRRHLVIETFGDQLRVEDQSTNGTYVGDRLLVRAAMLVGHDVRLRIGRFELDFPASGPARGSNAAAPLRPTLVPILGNNPLPIPDQKDVDNDLQAERIDAAHDQLTPPVADYTGTMAPLRRHIHRRLLDELDLAAIDRGNMQDPQLRQRVVTALQRIVDGLADLPAEVDATTLVEEMAHEALGLGPLEGMLEDEQITEIMVVDARTIFVERRGVLELSRARFTDNEAVRAAIERIVTPLGRRIDESAPLVDARLADGSRVNAIIPPLALRGPCLTIRKFSKRALSMPDLVRFGSLDERIATFLQRCVRARKNIVVAGGTGSGKTTLLNVLAASINSRERIVTIEDAAELRLDQPHVVSLEARPANMEGRGSIQVGDLLRNALRMRPDRIIVGECRGGEALSMLQAMNTGHEGSMTTTHANSPEEAIARLETLCLMSGLDLPARAIRQQIASSIHLLIQQSRCSDGSRRITSVAEVVGIDEHGDIQIQEIFAFRRFGTDAVGRPLGEYRASGYVPSFIEDFERLGLADTGDWL